MMANNQIRLAAKAASYNMILQLLFRISTFAMNGVLLHHMSKEVLGVVNVRLTLLYMTILFLSREAFRKACLNLDSSGHTVKGNISFDQQKKLQRKVNLIWISVVFGLFTASILSIIWIFVLEQPSAKLIRSYHIATCVFAISSVIELLVEPLWIFGQIYSYVRTKVIVEGLSLTFRCIVTVALVLYMPESTLLPFCAGHLAGSSLYVILYYGFFYVEISSISDRRKKQHGYFDPNSLPFSCLTEMLPSKVCLGGCVEKESVLLVLSFLKQSLLKQLLTEGERYIMTFFSIMTFAQQGVYDVVTNLGSLVARFIFMPLEESFYVFFSQTLVRGKDASKQDAHAVASSSTALELVIKFVCLTGITILVFGYSYSHLALEMYGGAVLTSNAGPSLLRTYCCYVLFMAVNGITECFMFAVMSKELVDTYNYKMLIFSVLFLLASLCFTSSFGGVGFILANCFNMGLRIYHSVSFIRDFFHETEHRPLRGMLPTGPVAVSLILSLLFTSLSEKYAYATGGLAMKLGHIAVGGCCLLIVAVCVVIYESELVAFLKNLWLKKDKRS